MEHGRQFKAEFGKTPRGVSRPQIWPMQFHQNILNNCIKGAFKDTPTKFHDPHPKISNYIHWSWVPDACTCIGCISLDMFLIEQVYFLYRHRYNVHGCSLHRFPPFIVQLLLANLLNRKLNNLPADRRIYPVRYILTASMVIWPISRINYVGSTLKKIMKQFHHFMLATREIIQSSGSVVILPYNKDPAVKQLGN